MQEKQNLKNLILDKQLCTTSNWEILQANYHKINNDSTYERGIQCYAIYMMLL
jgi:hypothetical protein